MTTTWVIGETREGALKRVSAEMVTAAKQAAADAEVSIVLIGAGLDEAAASAAALGVKQVLVIDDPSLDAYSPDGWAGALASLVSGQGPAAVLVGATMRGRDIAAGLAAELDAPVASDVVELTISEGSLEAVRPIYAGKALAHVRLEGTPLIATVRPNSFAAAAAAGPEAPVERLPLGNYSPMAVVVETTSVASARPDVSEADIIVSGGRGMGGPEHFALVEALADEMGAAVGASRAVVDAGWRPHGEQVGQTGKTVSPSLYIACGISGAVQHVAGMKTSKVIVAVNKDPEAPVFAVADYGIVADVFEAVPAITEALKRQRGL